MDDKEFRDKIVQKLESLNKKQVVRFAWRCGARALPFLGSSGNFNFWQEKQNNLYSVFYALDSSVAAANDASKAANDAHKAANSAFVGGVVAYAAANDAANAANNAANDAAYAAAKAAANSANAANAANAAYDAARAAANAAYDAARAAANAARAAAINNIDIQAIIIHNLDVIQNNIDMAVRLNPSDFYGKVWDNFVKALDAEGCAYWGRLYETIFTSGFVVDQQALERRLNVPKEIKKQGAAAVANYLEELEKGAARLNEARIIILGDKGAGKTCLAKRLIDPEAPMTTDDQSTAGVDTTLWKLEQEDGDINVRIWDFAGHTVTHAVHQFFLSERCLYIMVYDGRTEERNRLEYWLNHMTNYGGDSRAVILVNKRDQHTPEIPINLLKEQYPIAGVYTFSIKDDLSLLEAFRNEVAKYIRSNPSWEKQEMPASYYNVKNELEELFDKDETEKGLEHITREKFNDIAVKHKVKEVDKLLKDLHFLGVSLWYREMEEFNTLVLNPEWISHGVYKIINWVNEEKRHSLTLRDFRDVFKDDEIRYPDEKHKFLFNLMKHYELAYEVDGGDLIIPHLLKKDRPEELPVFPVGESLMLRYKAEQPLPPNTISRFIVRHNKDIKKEKRDSLVWRYGVVLEDGSGSIAMAREEDRTISVTVTGKDKTNYISRLRETLNDIFDSYKNEKPELQYRIEPFGQIPDDLGNKTPLWLRDSKILNHYQRGKPFYDDATDQNIPMAEVVNNYNIKAENVIAGGQGYNIAQNIFNFQDCNINLQGNLNELAQLLTENGNKDDADRLVNTAKALKNVKNIEGEDEVRESGMTGRLKRLLDELNDNESKLNKTVAGVKSGISIAQDIAQGYNGIAQWLGLPQVPKPFLK